MEVLYGKEEPGLNAHYPHHVLALDDVFSEGESGAVHLRGASRHGAERLVRYRARPPFALERRAAG